MPKSKTKKKVIYEKDYSPYSNTASVIYACNAIADSCKLICNDTAKIKKLLHGKTKEFLPSDFILLHDAKVQIQQVANIVGLVEYSWRVVVRGKKNKICQTR